MFKALLQKRERYFTVFIRLSTSCLGLLILGSCLQGCSPGLRRTVLITGGAGSGYAIGKQKDNNSALIGAGVGGLTALTVDKIYSPDRSKGYKQGLKDGKIQATLKWIEKLQREEEEGKELLRFNQKLEDFTYYHPKHLL